jgi:NAD(P)H-binding
MSGSFECSTVLNLLKRSWQKEADYEFSKRLRNSIGEYMNCKHLADKDLVGRTKFNWTILRPGPLTDKPAAGLVECGLAPFIGDDISVEFSLFRIGIS